MINDSLENRADVRAYSLIPGFMLRFFSRRALKRMYDKAIYEAVGDYETPALSGIPLDFKDIASSTVMIEKEIIRRGLDRKPLNPNEEGQRVYATEIWSNYT